jgi:hypothetical protein
VTKNFETSEKILPKVNAPTTPMPVEVSVSTVPIPSTHVSNSLDPVNSPVIPYDARASYINVALKKYPYLSLFNSDKHNDGYDHMNLKIQKEHNKGKVVGRCIKDSYYVKWSSPNEKKIKINASPEMISSAISKCIICISSTDS